jgi:polar amino acid transport system substrate-binding protein
LGSSVWWSTAAMTQRFTGDFRPMTLPGRTVAILWMVVSIVAIAVFTAGLTSAFTTRKLQGTVQNVRDLTSLRVGTVAGTATNDTLARMKIAYRDFATVPAGLKALHDGEINAFVHDKPLLAWIIAQNYSSSIELLEITFEPQTYGFALPNNSPLRKPLNLALLNAVQSDWWRATLFRYIGEK